MPRIDELLLGVATVAAAGMLAAIVLQPLASYASDSVATPGVGTVEAAAVPPTPRPCALTVDAK
jgi:hypothetical protein